MAYSIDTNFIEPIHTLKLNLSKIYDPLLDFKLYKEKNEAVEFLELAGNQAEKKYCEATYSQYVYPDVYWVHYVDGVKTKTYISSYQLNSFECSTLTPQTSSTIINGETIQYINNYIIDNNADFGEHHLKVTYKSPDTGNILKIEYSIYYLQEVGFEIGEAITWYPFRNLLTTESLGYGQLNFECTADNGEKITQTYSQARNTSNICYDFPVVANADFRFGDGQSVGYTFVSGYTYREYAGNIMWNIRPYSHPENTTRFYGYTVKDLILTEITIKSDVEYYSDIAFITDYKDMEDYYSKILQNSTKTSTGNVFEAPYISSDFSDHNVNIAYSAYSYPASTGYVYWGDGTLSFYAAGNYFCSSTSSQSSTAMSAVKLLNGYKLINGKRTAQYITPYKFPQTHTYDNAGNYTVVITSAYASELKQVSSNYQNSAPLHFYRFDSGLTPWTRFNGNSPLISGGTVTSYTPYVDFVLSPSPASSQVQELKIGDGCFVGAYRSVSDSYSYKRTGFYGAYNSDNTDGILTSYSAAETANLLNMSVLQLPKMSASCTPLNQGAVNSGLFNNAKALKDIYYNSTKADFQAIFGENGEYIDDNVNKFFVDIGNNATFRNSTYGATYTLNVHCSDGDITVTVD